MPTTEEVLAHIHTLQAQPDGTGNPEGRTEIHSYHVWEVLNALQDLDNTTKEN